MQFFFRTDADTRIGTGHIMRCLALAEALRSRGGECVFMCRGLGLGAALSQRIADAGHRLLALPEAADAACDGDGPSHAHWLAGGQASDAEACRRALAGATADWLVVDHYALDHRWQSSMRDVATRIMVIDDLADRVHECDLVLDQSLLDDMQTRYDGLLPGQCKRLLGPRYALLRGEFARVGDAASRPDTTSPRLLLMFGGADRQNLTLRSVDLLAAIAWGGDLDVAVGPLYSDLPALRASLLRLPRARLHAPAGDVATLMRNADLALGSPGVASWERCACGLPAITIAQAENQEAIGRALGMAGANFYLGNADQVPDQDIAAALRAWFSNVPGRAAMARAAGAICDGRGAQRVADRLMPPRLTIRPAGREDAELMYAWRNDERIRRYAHDPRPLSLPDHLAWVEQTLGRPDTDLLIACEGATPVACIRFDCFETRAVVSIYTDPFQQGRGFGRTALLAALDWLPNHRPGMLLTEADIVPGNVASEALFLSVGYQLAWARYVRPQETACTA